LIHNLPVAVTSFVGREREIATVRLLLDHARLVTVTGGWRLRQDPRRGLRSRPGCALWRFWWMHGYLSEGRERLTTLLHVPATALHSTRAKALHAAGLLALWQGDFLTGGT
jgi:hypothetical protein